MRKEISILLVLFFLLLTGTLLMKNLIKINAPNSLEIKQKPFSFITSYAVEESPIYEDKINFAESSGGCGSD